MMQMPRFNRVCLKNLAPLFELACVRFSRALRKFEVIAKNSDWFIALFSPVVTGRSNHFGIGFRQSFEISTISSFTMFSFT